MFNLSHFQVRNFFFNVYDKHNSGSDLEGIERIAVMIILEHPEYANILADKQKYLDYQWDLQTGETNPFLHLSMHLTIAEQLSVNNPFGIVALYHKLCSKYSSRHLAEHQLMDCIAEMLWVSQQNNSAPDINLYTRCVQNKLG